MTLPWYMSLGLARMVNRSGVPISFTGSAWRASREAEPALSVVCCGSSQEIALDLSAHCFG